jgi:hypothetical protein
MTKIIYQNESGGVAVIIPTGELSIEEVAAKDVPEGVAYEIVEDDAIPSDRTFRNAWVVRTLLKRMVSKWDALITATAKHLAKI